MGPCHGYSCLARSLEEQDGREARAARDLAEPRAGGNLPPLVPVLAAVAAPVPGVFAGTPLEIIRAALEPWRRSAT